MEASVRASVPLRILVVEDERLVRESIVIFLESMNYHVVGKADNGAECIKKAQKLNPDLIFMDIKMPQMDGIEAARQLQAMCEIPVILLTAFESEDLIRQASEAGVISYLMKPPMPQEIRRAVTIAMARHDDLMQVRQLNKALEERTQDLEKALAEIKVLRGILPICAHCKNIRNDEGYWEKVESYFEKHSDVLFTHGFCPDCQKKFYGEYLVGKKGKTKVKTKEQRPKTRDQKQKNSNPKSK
jgi:AmiR/NasT family two-component response regulator